jgi:hypothetical protein
MPTVEKTQQLRALGLCGADDSVHPHHLVVLANAFPLVEFGVLFRPDKEGQPRYATTAWVQRLAQAVTASNSPNRLKLAAHLCGSRVNEVLSGETAFLTQLCQWGFGRVQINATAVNGVDTSALAESVPHLLQAMRNFPQLEFILQKNDETRLLWQGFLDSKGETTLLPTNMSMLVDESKGTGVAAESWPSPSPDYEIGYAGGIGPDNIESVLREVVKVAQGRKFWIDMESSLRSTKNGQDVFDLDKCYGVIEATCELGLMERPEYLPK